MMNVYLAGCGQLGLSLGKQLQNDGNKVVGLKRSPIKADLPITSMDLSDSAAVAKLPLDADVIVFTVTPSDSSEVGFRQVYETILENMVDYAKRHQKPPLFILVSSTGVYGQQNGEWVDEQSETKPVEVSGRWILRGERYLQEQLDNHLTVRFSGIYGEERTWLIKKSQSGEPCQANPPMWTNRIHEADCVGILYFLIQKYQRGEKLLPVYLCSDDLPVSSYDVRQFICQQLNIASPPIKTENLSTACNKRCHNELIKQAGYHFIYPTYREGYASVLEKYRHSDEFLSS